MKRPAIPLALLLGACVEPALDFASTCPRGQLVGDDEAQPTDGCDTREPSCQARVFDYLRCLAGRPGPPAPQVVFQPPFEDPTTDFPSLMRHRFALTRLGLWGTGIARVPVARVGADRVEIGGDPPLAAGLAETMALSMALREAPEPTLTSSTPFLVAYDRIRRLRAFARIHGLFVAGALAKTSFQAIPRRPTSFLPPLGSLEAPLLALADAELAFARDRALERFAAGDLGAVDRLLDPAARLEIRSGLAPGETLPPSPEVLEPPPTPPGLSLVLERLGSPVLQPFAETTFPRPPLAEDRLASGETASGGELFAWKLRLVADPEADASLLRAENADAAAGWTARLGGVEAVVGPDAIVLYGGSDPEAAAAARALAEAWLEAPP